MERVGLGTAACIYFGKVERCRGYLRHCVAFISSYKPLWQRLQRRTVSDRSRLFLQLTRVLRGLLGSLELDNCLRFLEKYAKRAEAQYIRWQAFDRAAGTPGPSSSKT